MLLKNNSLVGVLVVLAVLFGFAYMAMIPTLNEISSTVANSLPSESSNTGLVAMPYYTSLEEDLAVALLPDPSFPSHAVSRHGIEAIKASECNASNYLMRFFNPDTKRTAFICEIEGFFGVHIFEQTAEEVTAFLKNKMKRVDQIITYMKNAGYVLLQ